MEKQLTKTVQKKIFAFFVASVVFISGAQSLFAMPDSTLNAVKGVEISYEGSKDKLLVFKVEYKNEISQDFQLIIRNDLNDIFYTKKFDANPLSSSIYLAELPENCKLTFSIRTGKKEFTKTFEINKEIKTVEEVVVKGI